MKKLLSFVFILVACFGFVTLVSAASKYVTLGGGTNTGWLYRDSTPDAFYTRVVADSGQGTSTIVTTVQRELLWIWGGGGKHTFSLSNPGTYTTNWTGMGTLNTRALWENTASGSNLVTGNFILNVK